ncbi:hypothetical protein [Azospirillum sp. ST 5-10]|uniref:hypothetical protein n=1 Tax=unclassified Azospirillum TaxID=2630922 RepID=UPI003F4A4C14
MADSASTPTSVQFTSKGSNHIEGKVTRHGDDDQELLNLKVNSLNIGREDVGGIAPEQAQASIVTIITLTWAT